MKRYLFLYLLVLTTAFCHSQSTHTITVNSSGNVATLVMTQAEYDSWKTNDGFNNNTVRQDLFKDIYKTFKDDFDFVFLVLNESTRPSNLPFGQLISVSNDVSNIGIPIYNNASSHGSAGKLKGVMTLTTLGYIKNGPSLHELMHKWGNFLLTTHWVNAFGTGPVDSLISNYKPHWGFTGGSNKGQLGGFNQTDFQFINESANRQYFVKEFGGNANGGNVVPYSEFELYLMGMIPLSEVKAFDMITDITWYERANTTNWDVYFNGIRTTYTPMNIESEFAFENAFFHHFSKEFQTVDSCAYAYCAYNSPDGHSLCRFGLVWINANTIPGFYNFYQATGGRGTMETNKLSQSLITGLSVNKNYFAQQIRIYPIPASKTVYIESEIEVESITVANATGQQMPVKRVRVSDNKNGLDVSSYAVGVYYLSIKSTLGDETVKKIVVE